MAPPKDDAPTSPTGPTAVELEANTKLAFESATALDHDMYSALLTQLKDDAQISNQKTESLNAKLAVLRKDQEEANEYLNKKIEDNYRVIAQLETDIMERQASRRETEFALIEQVVGGKENMLLEIANLQHALAEKEKDLELIDGFSNRREETSERLEQLRRQISTQASAHGASRDNLRLKHKEELKRISREWGKKLELTKASLKAITEDNLNKNTRRVMMEAEKMKNEVVYQATEVKKLHADTVNSKYEKKGLLADLKEAEKNEVDAAKKAHMYNRIIEKLKNKIDTKLDEIDAKHAETDHLSTTVTVTVREKLEHKMKAVIYEIREKRKEMTEFNQTEMEARTKITVMRQCQTPLVQHLLEIMRNFYDGDENEYNDGVSFADDDVTLGSLESAPPMHRGFTQDMIPGVLSVEEDAQEPPVLSVVELRTSEPGFSADTTLLEEEREIIGQIVGGDEQMREIFDDEGEEEDENDNDVASLSDLPRRKRNKYLRSLLIKVHSFQLQHQGGDYNYSDMQEAPQPNILTSSLGGDTNPNPMNAEFFSTKERKEKASASTQTDQNLFYKASSVDVLDESYKMAARKKLHRGVDSPGYEFSKIISLDGGGELSRMYGGTKVPPRRIPFSHEARKIPSRQVTPEVTGWARSVPTPPTDALAKSATGSSRGGKGRDQRNSRESGSRGVYAGNPAFLGTGVDGINRSRTDKLLKAAGLL